MPEWAKRGGGFDLLGLPPRPPHGGKMTRTYITVISVAIFMIVIGTLIALPEDSDAADQQGHIKVVVTDEDTTMTYTETYKTLSAAVAAVKEELAYVVPESLELHLYGTVSTGKTDNMNGPYYSFSFPSMYRYNSSVFIPDISIIGHDDATLISEYENVEFDFNTTGIYKESKDSEVKVINEGSVTVEGIDFAMNVRLLVEHALNRNVGEGDNADKSFNVTTVSNCGFQGTLYTLTNGYVKSNSAIVTDCRFSGENVGTNGYAYFAQGKFSSVEFEDNIVSHYPRGINIHLDNLMSSEAIISNNVITDIYGITGEGWNSAVQFTIADSIRVSGNTISDVAYNVFAVYPQDSSDILSDYLEAVVITNNHITQSACLLSNITEGFNSIMVYDNIIGEEVDLVNGYNRELKIQSNGLIVSASDNEIETDLPPIIWDDDDEYIPPVVPVQPGDSGDDDTTTIVACAAAAVVAALMAVFLIMEYRKN